MQNVFMFFHLSSKKQNLLILSFENTSFTHINKINTIYGYEAT